MLSLKKIIQTISVKDILPYIPVVLAIVIPLFFDSGYVFMTDFVWASNMNLLDWASGFFYFNLIIKILSFALPLDFLQKLFLSLAILTALLGGKKIADNFLESKWLVFVASLFFVFNPFVYDRIMYGQVWMVFACGFLFLAAGYLLEYLDKSRPKSFLLAALFASLAIQSANYFIFFAAIFYLLSFVLLFVPNGHREVKARIKLFGLAALIVFSLNANWLVGNFFGKADIGKFLSSGISKQDLVAFQTSGKTGGEALKNVMMMSGFWGKDQYRYKDLTQIKENWGRSLYFLLPLILLGLYSALKRKKEKENFNLRYFAIGLIFIYVAAVTLAVGIRLPVAREITYWLFDNLPFYKGLRETQKWASVIVVVYGIFLALGIKEFFKYKFVSANKYLFALFLGGIIIMQAPLLLWGFGGQVKPVDYPKDWYEANEFISLESLKAGSEKCADKILFLPWHLYMSFGWLGKIVANPAGTFFTCPVIRGTNMEWGGIYDNSQSVEGSLAGEWLDKKGGTGLIEKNELNIKWIILAKELDWRNYLWINNTKRINLAKETETLLVYKIEK